ncbi:hypothetical protein BCR44DRAFT_37317, partial [Catenaria anguillulae PL171]
TGSCRAYRSRASLVAAVLLSPPSLHHTRSGNRHAFSHFAPPPKVFDKVAVDHNRQKQCNAAGRSSTPSESSPARVAPLRDPRQPPGISVWVGGQPAAVSHWHL